ncbi:MAG: CehA/McbA family metallohydrolase [Sorangiineae bacterium]|nr:CehA/McbA family metallohydrolase [Polyangiaceae bacterium]MEB2323470.1 CehA/McbA family metallohydrolase [Sorangiineae bacterium]
MRAASRLVAPLAFALAVAGCAREGGDAEGEPAEHEPQDEFAPVAAPVVRERGPVRPSSRVSFTVRDAATHELIPCKLTVLGVHGSPDPEFSKTDVPRELDGAVAAYERVFSLRGTGSVPVPHGTYDVYVSRGLEWTRAVVRGLEVGSRGAVLDVTLQHVVPTDGWISGDFHVHSAASWDSKVPMRARVFEFASDGVEVMVSTDHNFVSDYAPFIEELGAGRWVTSVIGSEITTRSWGHFGAFPLVRDPSQVNGGAIPVRSQTPKQIFEAVRRRSPPALIDVHHPRLGRLGYFDRGHFDAPRAEFLSPAGTSLDFDALEILNGFRDSERHAIDDVLSDWFHLILHGYRFTGTGNSDTHHPRFNIGGYPRNFVRVPKDVPAAITPELLARAVKAGHAFFTTGPFLRLEVDGAGIGDTVTERSGKLRGHLEVDAAPWVSVTGVRLYVDGHVAQRWMVPPSSAVARLRADFELAVTRDAFVVLRAGGDQPLAPVAGEPGGFRIYPMALTNPVFIDVDGNGRYDAPFPRSD